MAGETAARVGANFSDYTGNSNLGGSTFGVAQLDTRPLMQLAAYTYEYKKQSMRQKKRICLPKLKSWLTLQTMI